MKICLWSDSSFEQSYASYHLLKGILLAMLNAGHEVWLVQVQRSNSSSMPEELLSKKNLHIVNVFQADVKKTHFASRYLNIIKYFKLSQKEVAHIAKENGLDAIFLQSTNAAYFPVKFAKKLGIPLLYNVQDIFPIDALVVGMLSKLNPVFVVSRWMQASAYKNADRVVTISEDLAKTLRHESKRNDIDVIYNWSYRNEPYTISDQDNHFLKTYNIKKEDGFRIVYAGNIGKMMNAEMMIQVAILLKAYKDIKFYIIGSGSNIAFLKRRIEEENLTNFAFYPSQPMEFAPDNYCMAHVNINPVPQGVMYTCMPSKTNTCLLSQKPTVVSMDLDSDMAKRLSSVDKWTVVAPNDAKSMAEAILAYYKSSNWNVVSTNAKDFMQELGPIENANKYVKILEEMSKK